MPEIRMSLVEASAILGIATNSVRSRYKSGKIRGEHDNKGRIWVWIDPESSPSKRSVSNNSIEPNIEALKILTEQLSIANLELADLRPKAAMAERLDAERPLLLGQIEDLKADRDAWRRLSERRGFWGLFRSYS